ncbi:hypothetical protein WOLCODRAFT_142135 [Wolfiporia cocos MD-104 SS10]|uniref:Uncharacterized protein n=1 Tax=Wolfiporia cocos (strain MD-104) TaxID=742152 RepID=A0A2H3J3R1_WOLCO|nr:hypothetical protein WOLCODRAFT_142135 [Wolfiporia cocos MD-104 SS10]
MSEELLLNHYLAYRAGRSFVFSNYTWSDSRAQYTYFDGKPIPSRIPLSVLIDGPTAGMPFVSDPHAPTAIGKEYWDEICPHPRVIRNDDVVAPLGQEPTAEALIERWTEVLQGTADPCVEVAQDSAAIFDYLLFGDPKRLLDAWPAFSQSPVLREFRWSPLIELAFDVNRETVSPSRALEPFMSRTPDVHSTMAERYSVLPGLLALHIRRGDYSHHCKHLVKHSSTYTGYSSFPSLPDKFVPPNGDHKTREKEYWRHCLPDIEQIVRRVAEVRRTPAGQSLRSVYVMTNGPAEWVEELKDALYGMGRWTSVASSRDLVVNAEQQYVKQAVDMLIGQRAQVFIGNGFSSLTGQVVMLRMASGIDPETNRFW